MKKNLFLNYTISVLVFLYGCFVFAQTSRDEKKPMKDDWEKTTLEENSLVLLRDARSYTSLKTLDLAIQLYDELVRRYPRNPFLLKEAGDVHAMKKNFERAQALYDQAAFLRPYDPQMLLAWVRAIENYKKNRGEAIQLLQKMIEDNPSFLEARMELADYFGWEKQWEQALSVLNQALKDNPNNIPVLLKKGEFLSWSKNNKAAIETFERILILDPEHSEAQEALGRVYMATNQWEKASTIYLELYKKNPHDPKINQALADAYFFDERYESAGDIYQSLSQSNPQFERSLSSRLSTITLHTAPMVTYPFLYYIEKNHKTDTKAESMYHSMEYSQPLFKALRIVGSVGTRHDDNINEIAMVYGLGSEVKLPKKMQHTLRCQWEPKVDSSNTQPRWNLNNVLAWKMTSRFQAEGFHRLTTYWDDNLSNSQGFAVSRFFFDQYDFRMGYRFTVDVIDQPNPYFISIPRGDSNLHLLTNNFNAEKYWNLSDKLVLTTATSYSVTDLGKNTLGLYSHLNMKLFEKTTVTVGTSWNRDNRDIESFSAFSYLSQRF